MGQTDSASFLVRVWREPREIEGETSPLRYYVRDLRTGQERYLSHASQLEELFSSSERRSSSGRGETFRISDTG